MSGISPGEFQKLSHITSCGCSSEHRSENLHQRRTICSSSDQRSASLPWTMRGVLYRLRSFPHSGPFWKKCFVGFQGWRWRQPEVQTLFKQGSWTLQDPQPWHKQHCLWFSWMLMVYCTRAPMKLTNLRTRVLHVDRNQTNKSQHASWPGKSNT